MTVDMLGSHKQLPRPRRIVPKVVKDPADLTGRVSDLNCQNETQLKKRHPGPNGGGWSIPWYGPNGDPMAALISTAYDCGPSGEENLEVVHRALSGSNAGRFLLMEAKTTLDPGCYKRRKTATEGRRKASGARHVLAKLRAWFSLTTDEQTWSACARERSIPKNRADVPTLEVWRSLPSRRADVVVICAHATRDGIETLAAEVYGVSDLIDSAEIWVLQSDLTDNPNSVTTALAYRIPRPVVRAA